MRRPTPRELDIIMDQIGSKTDYRDYISTTILPESFIIKHLDKFEAKDIIKYQVLSEHFMESVVVTKTLEPRYVWGLLSECQNLSEPFLRKYTDVLIEYTLYDEIAIFQTLTESFIRDFIDHLNQELLLLFQEMSELFISEMQLKGYFV